MFTDDLLAEPIAMLTHPVFLGTFWNEAKPWPNCFFVAVRLDRKWYAAHRGPRHGKSYFQHLRLTFLYTLPNPAFSDRTKISLWKESKLCTISLAPINTPKSEKAGPFRVKPCSFAGQTAVD